MACSEARLEANRRNAQLSTGPKTEAGKAISRGNALKDGLTGAGVVLPPPIRADFDLEYERWCAHSPPSSVEEEGLLKHLALAQARIIPLHDEQNRLEEANREYELSCGKYDRNANVQRWYLRLAESPGLAVAEITRSSIGCRWLADRWDALASGLADNECQLTDDDLKRIFNLLGIPEDERHISEDVRKFNSLYKKAKAGDATAHALLLERVGDHRRGLINQAEELESGHEAYTRAALESGRRVDMSPQMMRLRRIEAANTRLFLRCLDKLKALRAASSTPVAAAVPKPEPPKRPSPPPPPIAQPGAIPEHLREIAESMVGPDLSMDQITELWRASRWNPVNRANRIPRMGEVHMDIVAAAPTSSG